MDDRIPQKRFITLSGSFENYNRDLSPIDGKKYKPTKERLEELLNTGWKIVNKIVGSSRYILILERE